MKSKKLLAGVAVALLLLSGTLFADNQGKVIALDVMAGPEVLEQKDGARLLNHVGWLFAKMMSQRMYDDGYVVRLAAPETEGAKIKIKLVLSKIDRGGLLEPVKFNATAALMVDGNAIGDSSLSCETMDAGNECVDQMVDEFIDHFDEYLKKR